MGPQRAAIPTLRCPARCKPPSKSGGRARPPTQGAAVPSKTSAVTGGLGSRLSAIPSSLAAENSCRRSPGVVEDACE